MLRPGLLLQQEATMQLTAWYMASNHTFATIEIGDRAAMIQRISDLFSHDGAGSIFVKDESGATVSGLYRHGQQLGNGRYGMLIADIEQWADEVIAERAFHRLMIA